MPIQAAILPRHKYGSLLVVTTPSREEKPCCVEDLPDAWAPVFDSPLRESTTQVASFNLLSTILGGGALSLPYAFCKCGWLGGLLVLAFSVQISAVALNMLCTLARKLGCETYSDVVRKSMGRRWAEVLDGISFGMLFLVIIAFLILIKDISSAVIEYVFLQDDEVLSSGARSWTLYFITACMFPLMIQPSLHALRHVSYVGTASVMLLLCVIASKAAASQQRGGSSGGVLEQKNLLRMGPRQLADVFSALPIILIAFLCQFNVVGVYAKLVQPTGAHIHRVLQYTTYGSGLVYLLFGLAGYLIAYDATQDNILNNFSSRDPSLVVARLGLVFTLMCQTPMVTLPCIDSLLMMVGNAASAWKLWRRHPTDFSPAADRQGVNDDSLDAVAPTTGEMQTESREGSSPPRWMRPLATLLLVLICLIISEKCPGVAFIWTVAGSSISLILAFLFPSLAYISTWLRLERDTRQVDTSLLGAVTLLVTSVFMITLCSAQTVLSLMK